ncbi:NAD(P)H-dependent oxidoreductase [Actinomyces gaoshouyii]|uniref:NAD(P)H-dependent oxidoreductase n=1 Tax=Actinomyces gaoshouyii TaxID=1960083 RepID=UPI0009C0BCAA|nr:NAD(P)H-dependent oxidoreductase [Actinomyces gaoshouyii]ARD42081.1 NAD(P)H dehydrogenase [Actinomyces gaoshouyii]
MPRVLIVSGHTGQGGSVANATILDELSDRMPGAVVVPLADLYGEDFRIDAASEQAKLEAADVVVLQFPVFWYSMPSLLQRWVEQVFVHGWSHGSTGDRLRGKRLIISLTTGAPGPAYAPDGVTGHTIEELCAPIEATCRLVGMEIVGTIWTDGVSYQSRTDPDALASIKDRAAEHAERVIALVEGL